MDQQKNDICKELNEALESLESKLRAYLELFDRKELYSFLPTDERQEFYKNKYLELSLQIAPDTKRISSIGHKLATLLTEADKAMLEGACEELSALFFEYTLLEGALSDFRKNMLKIFESKPLSLTALLECARKLSFSVFELRKKLI
jgi:hypothetical protein